LCAATGDRIWVDRVDVAADAAEDAGWSLGQMLLAAASVRSTDETRRDLLQAALATEADWPRRTRSLVDIVAGLRDGAAAAAVVRDEIDPGCHDPVSLEGAARILESAGLEDEATELARRARSLRPTVPLDIGFSAGLRLVGWDPPTGRLEPGERFPLTWYWSLDRPIRSDWAVCVHCRYGERRELFRFQDDHVPTSESRAGTPAWRPGSIIRDGRSVLIPPDAPPGDYMIRVRLLSPRHPRVAVRPSWVDVGTVVVGDSQRDRTP
jgi:hypothetical protein